MSHFPISDALVNFARKPRKSVGVVEKYNERIRKSNKKRINRFFAKREAKKKVPSYMMSESDYQKRTKKLSDNRFLDEDKAAGLLSYVSGMSKNGTKRSKYYNPLIKKLGRKYPGFNGKDINEQIKILEKELGTYGSIQGAYS